MYTSVKNKEHGKGAVQKALLLRSRLMIHSLKMEIVQNQLHKLAVNELSPPHSRHNRSVDAMPLLKKGHASQNERKSNGQLKIKTEPSDEVYPFPLSMQSSLICSKKHPQIRQTSHEKLASLKKPTMLQRFCHEVIKKRKRNSQFNIYKKGHSVSIMIKPWNEESWREESDRFRDRK